MKVIYSKPKTILDDMPNSFCPGCQHSTISKLIAEATDELGVSDETIAVMPIGCGGMMSYYLDYDITGALHGRAPAVATGIKRVRPDNIVFAYQGDGDLASIGLAETVHAANRGENITTIFGNNGIFGMTGGQMAPTTLVGDKRTTAHLGRDPKQHGYPMDMCNIIDQLEAPVFIARYAVDTPANIIKAKAGIKKALKLQKEGKGYSFIEILATCPTGWGMTPLDSLKEINRMTEKFPLGIIRDVEEDK